MSTSPNLKTPTLLPPNLLLPTPPVATSVASPLQTSSPASPLTASPPASPFESPSSLQKFSSRSSIDIENGKRIDGLDEHGFIYISVKGDAKSRGFAQGFLLADRIVKFIRTYAFFLWTEYGRDITFFTKMIKDLFGPIVLEQYNEYYLEIDEIRILFKNYSGISYKNTDINDLSLINIIKHFYPEIIIDGSYITGISCNLWNKQQDIITFLNKKITEYKAIHTYISLYELYNEYIVHCKKNIILINKNYFDMFIKKHISSQQLEVDISMIPIMLLSNIVSLYLL